jgi:hypothetical protein
MAFDNLNLALVINLKDVNACKRDLSTIFAHQILRYVWRPPSFMRGRKNELAALAAFILTVDRIEGCNKL